MHICGFHNTCMNEQELDMFDHIYAITWFRLDLSKYPKPRFENNDINHRITKVS